MTLASDAGPRPPVSWVRIATAACVWAVLIAALASSVVWALTAPPTSAQLRHAVAELAGDGAALAEVRVLYVDSSHLGPRQVRGTFTATLSLDDAGISRIQANARRTGWQTTVFRDPDGTFVRATKDDLAADVSAAQVDLTTTVPPTVNVAVAVGGVAGAVLGCWLTLRRQRRETRRGRRWRRAAASGLLPPFGALAAAIPLFSALSGSARQVGDIASFAIGGLVFLAGLWVPVAIGIAGAVWLLSGRRLAERRSVPGLR